MAKCIKRMISVMSVIGLDLADVLSDWVGLDDGGKW